MHHTRLSINVNRNKIKSILYSTYNVKRFEGVELTDLQDYALDGTMKTRGILTKVCSIMRLKAYK